MTGEQLDSRQEQLPRLSTPEIYGPWIVDAIWGGEASDVVGRMKDIRDQLTPPLVKSTLAEVGGVGELESLLRKLNEEIATATDETVGELNRAMATYKDELPETYIQVEQGGVWKLVEGFAEVENQEIVPVIEGVAWTGGIVDVQQRGGDIDE